MCNVPAMCFVPVGMFSGVTSSDVCRFRLCPGQNSLPRSPLPAITWLRDPLLKMVTRHTLHVDNWPGFVFLSLYIYIQLYIYNLELHALLLSVNITNAARCHLLLISSNSRQETLCTYFHSFFSFHLCGKIILDCDLTSPPPPQKKKKSIVFSFVEP